jgi:cell division protein FtsN
MDMQGEWFGCIEEAGLAFDKKRVGNLLRTAALQPKELPVEEQMVNAGSRRIFETVLYMLAAVATLATLGFYIFTYISEQKNTKTAESESTEAQTDLTKSPKSSNTEPTLFSDSSKSDRVLEQQYPTGAENVTPGYTTQTPATSTIDSSTPNTPQGSINIPTSPKEIKLLTSGMYYVIAGSFPTSAGAKRHLKRLRGLGISGRILLNDGQNSYRIAVDSAASLTDATSRQQALASTQGLESWILRQANSK